MIYSGIVSIVAIFYLFTWDFDIKRFISPIVPKNTNNRIIVSIILILTSFLTIPLLFIGIIIVSMIFF